MDNWPGWKREFSPKPAPSLRATIYFRMKAMIRSYCKLPSLDQKVKNLVKTEFWCNFLEYLHVPSFKTSPLCYHLPKGKPHPKLQPMERSQQDFVWVWAAKCKLCDNCKYVSQRTNYCRSRFDTALAQLLFTPCLQIISQQLKAQGFAPQGSSLPLSNVS